MPFANGPHPALWAGAYHLFRFRARELPDIAYLNGLAGGGPISTRPTTSWSTGRPWTG
ncbi:hypothetical protein GCM10017687_03920 [Streptomyces echinatus]